MSYSYLQTHLCIPFHDTSLVDLLAERPRLRTAPMRSAIERVLAPLRDGPDDRLMYFRDAPWLEAHLEYLEQFTHGELIRLRPHVARNSCAMLAPAANGPAPPRCHFVQSSHEISCLAFVHVEAALAIALAKGLRAGDWGLFTSAPTGEKDEQAFLLSVHGATPTCMPPMPCDRHPELQWLRNPRGSTLEERPMTAALEPQPLEQPASGDPLLARWREFVQAQEARLRSRATRGAPVQLGSSHHTDGRHVFFGRTSQPEDAVLLEGCDPASFREHPDGEGVGHYGTDANGLWSCGEPLPCDAPQDFGPCAWDRFIYTDGIHLYKDGDVLWGVDAREVRWVSDPDIGDASFAEGFVHGDKFHWAYGSWCAAVIDPETFRACGRRYFADARHVYQKDRSELMLVEGFDPHTFRWLGHNGECYLLDRRQIAVELGNGYQPTRLKGGDPETFVAAGNLPFVVDARRVWLGRKVCKDLDAGTLAAPRRHVEWTDDGTGPNYFTDRRGVHAFQGDGYALHDADPATFEVLHPSLARDATRIWHHGDVVDGAQATSFRWFHQKHVWWTDGRHLYASGTRCSPVWLAAATDGSLRQPVHGIVQAQGRFYVKRIEVEGWSDRTHALAPFGCVEDARYLYPLADQWHGPIVVWPRELTADASPLATYTMSTDDARWRCTEDLAALAESAPPALLTREEFDTLHESIPPGPAFDWVTSALSDPAVKMTRMRGRTVSIDGDVKCSCMAMDDDASVALVESFHPATTIAARIRGRAAMARFLAVAPPFSFESLEQLEQRLPPDDTCVAFEFANCALQVQDGRDGLRGVWLDERLPNGEVQRAAVSVEGGFLASWYGVGPETAFGSLADGALTVVAWDAEKRARMRHHVANFLADTPARRPAARTQPGAIDKPTRALFCELVDLLAPRLRATQRKRLIEAVLKAGDGDLDHRDDGHMDGESPTGTAWEELLDQLAAVDLLGIFDRQNPGTALQTCHQLAATAGVTASFELSDAATGEAVSIALHFASWLQARHYTLLWPQGALLCSNDEHYPAVIVEQAVSATVRDLARSLDGERVFLTTDEAWSP